MMIEHLAIWTKDIEKMNTFYLEFFEVSANEKYFNPTKNFSSYFLSFPSGTRIELMHRPEISKQLEGLEQNLGLAHFAIALGSKQKVDDLTTYPSDERVFYLWRATNNWRRILRKRYCRSRRKSN